jgi:outer membrane protein assembly complex protein YaeT
MLVRWLIATACFGALLAASTPVFPQSLTAQAETDPGSLKTGKVPVLEELRFTGLRHIAPGAVAAQVSLRVGEPADPMRIEKDVRALARLGWFDSIQVEAQPSTTYPFQSSEAPERVAIVIHLKEFPFFSGVEYTGSRLLPPKQIEKLLKDKKLAPRLGEPANPLALQRIALAIRHGLNDLGHPDANVLIRRKLAPNATVFVRFEIEDGPFLPVRRVDFEGDPQLRDKLLHKQMRNIAPWKPLASWRGKNAYTRDAFEDDSRGILLYYQDHGYPEARVGSPRVERISVPSRQWLPWPHDVTHSGLSVSIPVQAGPFYRLESIESSRALLQAAKERPGQLVVLPGMRDGKPYSADELEKMRRLWLARIQPKNSNAGSLPYRSVEARQSFDTEKHTVHVKLDLSDSPPYVVQRIEFQGLHRFSDRYLRRRIVLREGRPVDERALEAGLARIARTGYFKPIRREDIHVRLDEATHTASVTIHVEEIGQQRASLVGGQGQFGSTLGIAYTVFDLLNCEELLSAQLEGGPESVQIMLGLAKEGIFGTRGSLALSVFNNVIRPRFASSAQGPFFTTHSEGVSIPWSYPLTNNDSLGVNYMLSRTTSEYPLGTPPVLTGLPPLNLRMHISSRALGTAWTHDAGNERILFSDSISGGLLGGGENMLRSSSEYAHIFRDPLFSPNNAWAFRTTVSGAGSYSGDMPFYARFFSGDELVRGLRTGELGPYALTTKSTASGATMYSAAPAGANLIEAANAEYRVHLGAGTEAVGFLDFGSGWLLPSWLGPARPLLLNSTNGVLHGSTGIELRWTVPGIQVPVRAYYALNALRLNRSIVLSNKSLFLARNRFSAFGWALGSLF